MSVFRLNSQDFSTTTSGDKCAHEHTGFVFGRETDQQ